jgi:hypothetical protein
MNREITVSYSRELIKFAVWKFWTRNIGLRNFVIFALVCVAFILVFLSGDCSWFLGFLGAAIVFSFGLGCVSYFISLRSSMKKFNRMETPTAKFRFTDERIGIESNIGWTELSWKMIEKIWEYPSVWLIFIAKQGYVTLPTANHDDELKQFIVRKVRS